MAGTYFDEDRHNTKLRIWNLLNYLQQNCNLIISEDSKFVCAEELSDRHAFAIFYQINGGTDIVIGKNVYHMPVFANNVISQMDNDSMYAFTNNKGIIVMILGYDPNVLQHTQTIQYLFSVKFTLDRPNQWTQKSIIKRTITDTVETLLKRHHIVNTAHSVPRTLNFVAQYHGYIIFNKPMNTQNSMYGCVQRVAITNGITDLATLQHTLLNPPDASKVPMFAITYDQQLDGNLTIYVLDSRNNYYPEKVELRCNSLLRRLAAQAEWQTSLVTFQ